MRFLPICEKITSGELKQEELFERALSQQSLPVKCSKLIALLAHDDACCWLWRSTGSGLSLTFCNLLQLHADSPLQLPKAADDALLYARRG